MAMPYCQFIIIVKKENLIGSSYTEKVYFEMMQNQVIPTHVIPLKEESDLRKFSF